jgi:hypothetical protein
MGYETQILLWHSYQPDQDVGINKISKRLGTRLLSIEQKNDELDPLLHLVAVAHSRIRELSGSTMEVTNASSSAPIRVYERRAEEHVDGNRVSWR